jgi:hypothetical protein
MPLALTGIVLVAVAALITAGALSRGPSQGERIAGQLGARYGGSFSCSKAGGIEYGDARATMYWCANGRIRRPCAVWVMQGRQSATARLAGARALLQGGQPRC